MIQEKLKMSAFFISEKAIPKMDKVFNFLPYIQKAAKLGILIFCNILNLEMGF